MLNDHNSYVITEVLHCYYKVIPHSLIKCINILASDSFPVKNDQVVENGRMYRTLCYNTISSLVLEWKSFESALSIQFLHLFS